MFMKSVFETLPRRNDERNKEETSANSSGRKMKPKSQKATQPDINSIILDSIADGVTKNETSLTKGQNSL